MKFYKLIFISFILFACSTEKNTLVNRSYHGMTAHYNGYFNANELLTESLNSFYTTRKDDYYSILPLNPLPNEEAVKGMYPAIDTAIAKCTKVISKHSMPTASEPSKKRSEHNAWIDENWLTIGKSNYYRRDYELAQKNFIYVNKFYSNDPSNYSAAIWLAKTNIEMNKYSDAKLILKELDKKVEILEAEKEAKKFFGKKDKTKSKSKNGKKKKRKSKDEEEEKAKFYKEDRFALEKTKAEIAIHEEEDELAIEYLTNSLKFCKKSKDKARIHYILAQLCAKNQKNEDAKYHFGKVLKYNAPFEMSFNARINRALMGGSDKIKKELQKMLRDDKNIEFKDQIYYALADIAFKEGNTPKGIELMHKSILHSTTNNRQKAICYEKLGDMSFSDKEYVKAQKYYDSCVQVFPENYPNAQGLRNKALKLKDLVFAVETAYFQDSVQRIASLSENDRTIYAEKLLKKIQDDEKRRKEQDAIRLKEIQSQQASVNESKSGSKFFWNTPKLKSEGLEAFRKQWGPRENEDNWRRSEKIALAPIINQSLDSLVTDSLPTKTISIKDSLTVEDLLANIPMTDSSLAISNFKMLNAYYDAGIIYKDQLNETQMAIKQFETILSRKGINDTIANQFRLLALFQLYKIYEIQDPTKAYSYKSEILVNFPNSDYANYLSDPDFFIKKKQFEALAEESYIIILDRFNKGLYNLVISAADQIIEKEPKNPYLSKYLLLKALSHGNISENKNKMIALLSQLITQFPSTSEAKKAKEIIDIHTNGYSAFQESKFNSKSIYKYVEDESHWIIIFIDPKIDLTTAKSKVSDFNKEFYSRDRLNLTSKIYGRDQNIIVLKEMSEDKTLEYIRTYKRTKKLLQMQDAKIMSINQENLKILFESLKLDEYEMFYAEFY